MSHNNSVVKMIESHCIFIYIEVDGCKNVSKANNKEDVLCSVIDAHHST